jgi:chromosome segregation ATPase
VDNPSTPIPPVDNRFAARPHLATLITMSSPQELAHRVNRNTNDIEALYDISKDTNIRVTEIAGQVTEIQQTLHSHSQKLDSHSQKLDSHSQKLDSHSQKLDSHSQKLDEIGQTLNQHNQKFDEVLGLLRDRP